MKKNKPKKAKLITNGGFSKIIPIEEVVLRIDYPYSTKVQLNSPELYGIPVEIACLAVFELEKVNKKIAIYKQVDVVILK